MSYSVFLDFDGTLVAPGQKKISDRTLNALQEARKAGFKLFLNTGRAISYVDFDALRGFKFDGYLCGSTYVNVGGKLLMADGLTADETQPITAHFYGRGIVVLLEGEVAMYAAYDEAGEYADEGMIPVTDMREIFRICELEPICKMNVMALLEGEDLEFVRQFADPIPRDDANCTELLPKGHNKATVMERVIDYLELDRATVVAVGDTRNDIPMLDYAPISAAMGNASDEVKAHAKRILPSAAEDGVAVLLEELMK